MISAGPPDQLTCALLCKAIAIIDLKISYKKIINFLLTSHVCKDLQRMMRERGGGSCVVIIIL